MIVGSLVLILSAAGLLTGGLLLGSDWLLGASIVASLIAAVMLYIGARQNAATRAERRAAADWDSDQPVEEFDRRDSYPAAPDQGGYQEPVPTGYQEPVPTGYQETEQFDAVGHAGQPEQPGRYDAEERFDAAPGRTPGEDRFADLRQYEDAAFSDPDMAGYDRRAGYPEPPVAERTWQQHPTERVPSQRDATGDDHDAGADAVAGGYTEPSPTAEHPTVAAPGGTTEPITGQHAAVEPIGSHAEPVVSHAEPVGSHAEPAGSHAEPAGSHAEPTPAEPQRPEASVLSAEARRLDQLPPEEVIGGGVDDEDPKDEPPIQRRPARVAAAVARLVTDVFVIDGRPRYHVPGCVHLLGRESEPLPADEAVDLGFSPCSLCEPDTVLTAGSAEKARH